MVPGRRKHEEPRSISRRLLPPDGVLTEVSVTEGMRLCAVGDTVRQGQLLVSGYEDYGLFIRPVCASAEIYARTRPARWDKDILML